VNLKILATILLLSLSNYASSTDKTNWSEIALEDLKYIYTNVKENHPGYVDKENPSFKSWANSGYKEGIDNSKNINSANEVVTILRAYVAGFADGHFNLKFSIKPDHMFWTGILVEKQSDHYYVTHLETEWPEELPPFGSRLISCNNRDARSIMLEDILKYKFNSDKVNSEKFWQQYYCYHSAIMPVQLTKQTGQKSH